MQILTSKWGYFSNVSMGNCPNREKIYFYEQIKPVESASTLAFLHLQLQSLMLCINTEKSSKKVKLYCWDIYRTHTMSWTWEGSLLCLQEIAFVNVGSMKLTCRFCDTGLVIRALSSQLSDIVWNIPNRMCHSLCDRYVFFFCNTICLHLFSSIYCHALFSINPVHAFLWDINDPSLMSLL